MILDLLEERTGAFIFRPVLTAKGLVIEIKPRCWLGYIRGTTYAYGKWGDFELKVWLPTNRYREFKWYKVVTHKLYYKGKLILTILFRSDYRVFVRGNKKYLVKFRAYYTKSDESTVCAWNQRKGRCVCHRGASGWLLYYFKLQVKVPEEEPRPIRRPLPIPKPTPPKPAPILKPLPIRPAPKKPKPTRKVAIGLGGLALLALLFLLVRRR